MVIHGKKHLAFAPLFFFYVITHSFSQNKITYESKPVTDSSIPPTVKIIFKDSISEKIIKTIEISRINPFNKFHYKIVGKNQDENFIYKISGKDVKKLFPESSRSNYSDERRNVILNQPFYYGSSNYAVDKESRNYSVVYFTFFVEDDLDYPLGVLGSIIVFNDSGIQIYKNTFQNLNVKGIALTENAKYLSFIYGVEDEKGILLPSGYQIINLKTKSVIFEKHHPNIGHPIVNHNLLINGFQAYNENIELIYEVFDSDKGVVYTKGYSNDNLRDLEKILDNGILFSDKKGNNWIDYFEQNFTKEIIKMN